MAGRPIAMRADELARTLGISTDQVRKFIRDYKIAPILPMRRNRLFDYDKFIKVIKGNHE